MFYWGTFLTGMTFAVPGLYAWWVQGREVLGHLREPGGYFKLLGVAWVPTPPFSNLLTYGGSSQEAGT